MERIETNIAHIKKRMEAACRAAGRSTEEVRLLLATKTVTAPRIREALAAGCRLIGENKVQELKSKFDDLKDLPHETHFIGHLQTNKIKDVLRYADCIQSVDRIALAEKLDSRLQKEGRAVDILMQVNTSAEESKFGVAPEGALSLIRQLSAYDTLRIRGLMTIGLFSADLERVRACFQLLRQLRDQIQEQGLPNVDLKELSMGMSGDLEVAIEEGATIVRVGTAIFGERQYPDSYYWNEQGKP